MIPEAVPVLALTSQNAHRIINRTSRHYAGALGVAHLGPVIEVLPVNSPAPLDRKAVIEAVSSSDSWASSLRKLGLATVMGNYRRVQEIARSAGITPTRICAATDYVPPGVPIPPPVTVWKGTCTEAAVLSALIGVGYNVLIPFGVARYDLVIEVADGFRRVQCKTARLVQPEMMRFNVCSGSPEGVQRTYVGEIDFLRRLPARPWPCLSNPDRGSDAMKERASAPGGCWKLQSIRLHQGTGGPR